MTNCKTPCPQCAFRRDIEPGKLGGSPPEVYIGQIMGPFMIPCHMHYGDIASRKELRAKAFDIPQCAGAAVFRENMGVTMPAALHRLPADHQTVFSDPVEFYMHHKGISREEAQMQLTALTPDDLRWIELNRVQRLAQAGEPVIKHLKED